MKEETLLSRARGNYNVAKVLLDNDDGDESFCNFIGYHLQQAIELSMKYQLEQEGIHYPHDHDINILLGVFREAGIESCLSEYVKDHSDMFSAWESKTRYILNYQIERERIVRAFPEVEETLEKTERNYGTPWQGQRG